MYACLPVYHGFYRIPGEFQSADLLHNSPDDMTLLRHAVQQHTLDTAVYDHE